MCWSLIRRHTEDNRSVQCGDWCLCQWLKVYVCLTWYRFPFISPLPLPEPIFLWLPQSATFLWLMLCLIIRCGIVMSLELVSVGNLALLDCLVESDIKSVRQRSLARLKLRMLWSWVIDSSSICHCLLLVRHFPWPCLQAAGPNVHLWTCGHVDIHQLTPCLSHGLYLSRVQTHKALVGPALCRARPYIYPTLLLRVTNMGRGWGGGHPANCPLCGVVLT